MEDLYVLMNKEIMGGNTRVSVTYKDLYKNVKRGSRILINDGLIELEVEHIENQEIHCTILNGGTIG
ncbi:MAG TPA: pyruvate kinase, partial [Clostridia bacterium]|nr:pyruvate kinase [Clostridia bacterium]